MLMRRKLLNRLFAYILIISYHFQNCNSRGKKFAFHKINELASGNVNWGAATRCLYNFFRNFKGIFHVIIEYLENVRMRLFDADGGEVHVGEAMGGVTFCA